MIDTENETQTEAQNERTQSQTNDTDTAQETQTAQQEAPEADTTDSESDKLAQLTDAHMRLMADFDNYKKRTLKEKSDLIKFGGESILKNMLPVIDDFERALANMPEGDDPVKEGVVLIYNKFIAYLNQCDVKAIETKDAVFDTDFHEAVTVFPAANEEQKGKVIDCIQKGYLFHDKVIRCAKVVVAQ